MEHQSNTLSEYEEQLYDRSIRLWGLDAQKRLRAANVLLIGFRGLNAEICKNLVLAGVKSVTIMDDEVVSPVDLGAHLFLSEESIGKNRAEASIERVQALNPLVQVKADTESLESKGESFFLRFAIVCITNKSLETLVKVDNICRSLGVYFVAADSFGLYSYFFSDLHKYFYTKIEEAEKPAEQNTTTDRAAKRARTEPSTSTTTTTTTTSTTSSTSSNSNDNIHSNGNPSTDSNNPTGTETTPPPTAIDANTYYYYNQNMYAAHYDPNAAYYTNPYYTQHNRYHAPYAQYAQFYSNTQNNQQTGGEVNNHEASEENTKKVTRMEVQFVTLAQALATSWKVGVSRRGREGLPRLFVGLPVLYGVRAQGADADGKKVWEELSTSHGTSTSLLPEDFISSLTNNANLQLAPVCAIVGGVAAQEIIKIISANDIPLNNFFFYDSTDGSGNVDLIK